VDVTDIVGIGGLIINAVAFGALLSQVYLLRKQIRTADEAFGIEQVRSRKQSTLEFLAATVERRQKLSRELPVEIDHAASQRVLEVWDHDEDARRPVYEFLDFYEMLATGVNSGIFDLEVVDRASGSRIIRIHESYGELIEKLRAEQERPRMYEELQGLAATIGSMRIAAQR